MYILANMWFTKLIKQFFFWIDKIVYNFISSIYDLLLTIARTSVLTQADIADMAGRIYKLLAIFMIFKVTLSLITYVVNPDDFSDKSKGVAKLGTNIVISLAMLVLTPYIFNYAYQFQTIILEDNSLATLIFGGSTEEENSFFNTAGDDMAYITMSAFISPNLSLGDIHECSILIDSDTKKFNGACKDALTAQTSDQNFKEQTLKNYIGGVENSNLELLFRQDLVLATDEANEEFIMDYKFIFSTVVGVVIILLLITFCMDVAVRSIKLAFLQLIAPIPILSYVDPKSGKDGLFKKWYEMCIKTFISLFVRLLALYFAVYIISKVADLKMVDLVDGSYQTNALVAIFIIIGALMFAKQLPKILEGLGIKLDGDGKFTLNPFKKFEEEALGGKRITGAAGGAVAGLIGGKGIGAIGGAARGFMANKGYAGGLAKQADYNRKLREAKVSGAGFWGSRAAALSSRYGLDDADLEGRATNLRKDKRAVELKQREVEQSTKQFQNKKKAIENAIAPKEQVIAKQRAVKASVDEMEKFSTTLIESGKAGKYSDKYKQIVSSQKTLANNVGKVADIDHFNADGKFIVGKGETITADHVTKFEGEHDRYAKKVGRAAVMDEMLTGSTKDDGSTDNVASTDLGLFQAYKGSYDKDVEHLNSEIAKFNLTSGEEDIPLQGTQNTFKEIHNQAGYLETEAKNLDTSIKDQKQEISDCDKEIKNIQVSTRVKISGKIPEGIEVDENGEVSYEDAQNILATREKRLKDDQEQRKLNRGLAKDRSFENGSGK